MGDKDATLRVAVAIIVLSFPAMLVVVVTVVAVATDATVVPVSPVVSPNEVADATDAVDGGDDGFAAVLSSGGGDASSHNAWLRTSSLTLGFPPCQQIKIQYINFFSF